MGSGAVVAPIFFTITMTGNTFIDILPHSWKRTIQKAAAFGSFVPVVNKLDQKDYIEPITVQWTNGGVSREEYLFFAATDLVYTILADRMRIANLPTNPNPPTQRVIDAMLKFRPVYIDHVWYKVSNANQLTNDIQYVRGKIDGSLEIVPQQIPSLMFSDQADATLIEFNVDWEFGADTALIIPIDPGVTISITVEPSIDQRRR